MNEKNSGTFTLINDKTGDKYTLPVIDGTTGPSVIDVRTLYGETDHFTFDPGYTSTGSCESALTYIDGDKGILLHRGYPIEQLAEHSNFLEVAHLLLYGDLPNQQENEKFVSKQTEIEDSSVNNTLEMRNVSFSYKGSNITPINAESMDPPILPIVNAIVIVERDQPSSSSIGLTKTEKTGPYMGT